VLRSITFVTESELWIALVLWERETSPGVNFGEFLAAAPPFRQADT
jgi:hypothetical protein